MIKHIFLIITTLTFSTCLNAAIININSVSNTTQNPVSVYFDAGTHILNPIGVADGGNYNAWSTHIGAAGSWLWRYNISSNELGIIEVNHLPYSQTEMDAFATAVSASFTLTTGAFVDLYVYDGPGGYAYAGDNYGGISLSTVPVPPAIWLFGTGLIGLFSATGRKKA